ncbi:MAG: ribose 5-phosphate isomerase B [Clostridia bacterium]|nr:ribose 5-phosphate isomerase B [Clostridia bacterium]
MKLAIGADHGGFTLKETVKAHLIERGFEVEDCGTFDEKSVNYAPIAKKVADKIVGGECERGILICGTGIGMSMAANKVKGIRAAHCGDCFCAKYTRLHNDANILCMGARITGAGLALEIVDLFVDTEFEGGRHIARIAEIADIENGKL